MRWLMRASSAYSERVLSAAKWMSRSMPMPSGPLHFFQLGYPHGAEFGRSHAEIAKAECEVGVFGIEFGEQPRCRTAGVEQLDDRFVIDGVLVFCGQRPIRLFVFDHWSLRLSGMRLILLFLTSLVLSASEAAHKINGQPSYGERGLKPLKGRVRTRGPIQKIKNKRHGDTGGCPLRLCEGLEPTPGCPRLTKRARRRVGRGSLPNGPRR